MIKIIDPRKLKEWDSILLRTPEASFFHSTAWAKVLCESYHYQPLYITEWDGESLKALLALMDVDSFLTGRRGVSLPFTDYCDPIAPDNETFRDLLNEAVLYGKEKGWKHLEIRGGAVFLANGAPSCTTAYGHTLGLSRGADEQMTRLRDSTRRNIKKAVKEGVTVSIRRDMEALRFFYNLNCMTRQEHGLPPQPFSFFEKIHEHILSHDKGCICLAEHGNQPVAASIFFHFGDKAIYKYGASDKNAKNLRANNLVMWEAICWYIEHGYKHFCFGRTEKDNDGLRQFKNGWGTQENKISYFKYDLLRNQFVTNAGYIASRYKKVFQRIPVPALRVMGKLLYRHMG
jgi:hypothetical protein